MRVLTLLLFFVLSLQPASVLTVNKTPFEIFICSMDFGYAVGTDAITFSGISASNIQDGSDASAITIAAAPTPALVPGTKKVAFAVQGGVSGSSYLISVRIVDTTTGEQYEGRMTLIVN
jgi:hypothetical protein